MLTENQELSFEEVANDLNLEFRNDYSGRNMFGVKTLGVVGEMKELCFFLEVLGARLSQNKEEMIKNFALDNMGKSFILYVHQ